MDEQGTSLVIQWLRICLEMQGKRIQSGQGTKIPHALEQLDPHTRMKKIPQDAVNTLCAATETQRSQLKK